MKRARASVSWDGQLFLEDAAVKGLDMGALLAAAQAESVSGARVRRFLAGEVQTVPTAAALAKITGHDLARYIIRKRAPEAAPQQEQIIA